MPYEVQLSEFQTTIHSGTSLSDKVDIRGLNIIGIEFPSGWDAASVTFQMSIDDVTYANVYTTSAEMSFTAAAASRFIAFPVGTFPPGVKWIKVRSGTSGSPVNQTADRLLKIYATRE